MCIFDLQVLCSCYTVLFLFLRFLSFTPIAFWGRAEQQNWSACILWLWLLWLLFIFSTGALTDGKKRQLHILLSIFWGLCFLSIEQPLHCVEVRKYLTVSWDQRCGSVNREQEIQNVPHYVLKGLDKVGTQGERRTGGQCRARDRRSAAPPRAV